MSEWRGKKVGIVGLGRSGEAACRYLAAMGADLYLTDSRPASAFAAVSCVASLPDDRLYFGTHATFPFDQMDALVVSPGIPLTLEGLVVAKKKGIPIMCEMELARRQCATPVIAITGTNGKSTVTTLIGKALEKAGVSHVVAGNIGLPFIEVVEKARECQYVVLEVSSYQAELTPSLLPHVAVVMNITPDHLDRYASFDAYADAKMMMVSGMRESDHIVYNGSDPLVSRYVSKSNAQKHPFTRHMRSFDRAKLVGTHNIENMTAAHMVATLVGVDEEVAREAIGAFAGLPHRTQFVGEFRGVRYYDDSKGTNVGAVVKSLEGFSGQVILIAGGQDKHTGYADLVDPVRKKVKQLILIGEAAPAMEEALGSVTAVVRAKSLEEAVSVAVQSAVGGDVVLLSPACASFDMFTNYAERGDRFQKAVREMAV